MKSEKEKMLRGELYDPRDAQLASERRRARLLLKVLNDSSEDQQAERARVIGELFGAVGEGVWIEPPFFCDYGSNIKLGAKVFFNFNCVVLDVAPVAIGDNVLFGPNVQLYTAMHPLDTGERRRGLNSPSRSGWVTTSGSAAGRSSARGCVSGRVRLSARAA